MMNTPIEIIFEECGWVYMPKEGLWRFGKFKISRLQLHKALKAGKGQLVRRQMIAKFLEHGADEIPEMQATVERLKVGIPSEQ